MKQSTEEWMRRALLDDGKGAPCTSFALVHVQGGLQTEIHVKPLPDKLSVASIGEIADTFDDIAKEHAAGLPGAQQYQILAFYGGRKTAQAFRPFVQKGYTEMEGLATESPGPMGVLAQSMRHLEAKGSAYIQGTVKLLEAQNRTIELQNEREIGLRRENVEMFGALKEMIMAMTAKSHEARMAELAFTRETEERRALYKTVPGLINSVTGREVFPQAQEDTSHLEAIIDAAVKKGPEALRLIQSLELPPAAQFALASRFQRAMAARENEHAARAPQSHDPEDDVNGGKHLQ